MLPRRYFRLRTLGQLSLASVSGDVEASATVRRRHLAVLAVLALARRPITRDALVEMFWGGETEKRARHSLSNALSGLRALLGPDAITARLDRIALADDVPLEIDALQFTAACEARDDERALALYGGPFLPGIHVDDAPEFESWAARERGRFERFFLESCERRVPELLQREAWADAAGLAERWLDASPRASAPFVALLRAEAGAGTPVALASALAEFERISQALLDTYDIRPDAAVVELTERLHNALASHPGHPVADAPRLSALAAAVPADRPVRAAFAASSHPAPRRGPRVWPVALLGIAAALTSVALWLTHRDRTTRVPGPPVVAVTTIDDVRGDTSVSWLRAGLPRMIAIDLAGRGEVEVVPPVRVRDVLVRLAGSPTPRITQQQSADVARRLGAAWVVTGGVSTADGGYLLDVTLRDVDAPGDSTQSFVVQSANPIDLGRLAAARLASLLNVAASGTAPRYSGVETNSPDAYRDYVRGMLAVDAERWRDAARDLDAAIMLDSGFVVAVRAREDVAATLGDTTLQQRLALQARRYAARLPEFDRSSDQIHDLDSLGESARADAMAQQLVTRFPHDPRAYSLRADLLSNRGQWAAADSVLVRELALDSLAISAGDGPCTPCEVYRRLSQVRLERGDRVGAEAAARRWVALQPDVPATWRNLSATLAAVGRSAEAMQAGFHYVALSRESPAAVEFGRTMIAARHPEIADSLVRSWRGTSDPVLADGAVDLASILQREHGRCADALRTLASVPRSNGLVLVRADCLAREGRLAEARRLFEELGHPPGSANTGQYTPSDARAFTWVHALEADALLSAGDTAAARALVDSLVASGRQSYYGRDRLLYHHVLGMLDFAQGRYVDADRELRAAEWAAGGWTRTNVELARTQLAESRPADAIATLRDAYTAPVDAMGRYVTRSELDWWMARAFSAAGRPDSARVYAGYVGSAWRDAEPAVRARLDSVREINAVFRPHP